MTRSEEPRRSSLRSVHAALISRKPVWVLVIGVALAVVCIGLTILRLEFQADRNELLSRSIPWNQRFIDWFESFPGATDLMVVVASDPEDDTKRAAAIAFVRDLVPSLEADPDIDSVEWGAPQAEFTPKAARLLPMERFRDLVAEAEKAAPLLDSATPGALLQHINERIRKTRQLGGSEEGDPESIAADIRGLTEIVTAIREGFQDPGQAQTAFARLLDDPTAEPWLYLESPTGRLIFVLVSPRTELAAIDAFERAIASTRRVIQETRARHPGVEVGLTGTEVIDSDETVVATFDSSVAAGASLVLIALLLILAFHSLRMPLILLAALLVGVAWSFGWLLLSVGHLQLLSVVFIAVLLGLGVDFGIHFDSTYEQLRRNFPDGPQHFETALSETVRLSAPGILTGALTTAAAFLTTAFTDFKGVAEMGIIASGGVVLCLVSMFTIFPALLRLLRHSHRHVRPLEDRSFRIFHESWILPISRRPGIALAIALAVVLAAGVAATRVRFLYDLLALHPEGVESVTWQERVIDDGGASVYFGVSISDELDEVFERQERFRRLPSVANVGGIGLLRPPDEEEKLELIRGARQRMGTAIEAGQRSPEPREAMASTSQLTGQLTLLRRIVARTVALPEVPPPILEGLEQLRAELDRTEQAFSALPGPPPLWRLEQLVGLERLLERDVPERVRRVAEIDRAWVTMRQELASRLGMLLEPTGLLPEDFPVSIMRPFVDASDPDRPRYCLHIFPKLPDDPEITNPLSPLFLPGFVEDLVSVDPEATGVVVQVQRSGDLIWSSYRQAGVAALVVVFVLVWLVFRSIGDTLLAMMPVVLSFLATFGVMAMSGVYLNPANLMVLPLLFGIGVDAGVHVVHRSRLNPEKRPIGLTYGTGKGITLTSLTTMFGFASMMLARHRGVASLGFVMTIGLGCIMLVCWTVLPAILELVQRRREKAAEG